MKGIARIQKVPINLAKGLAEVKLTPKDLSNPVSFQLTFSRLYETLLKTLTEERKYSYVAEVRFRDSLGNDVVFAIDLGEEPPPFENRTVRARVVVELYEE